MNTHAQASNVAVRRSFSPMGSSKSKTVVRAAKGELVYFAGYDPMAIARTLYEEEVVDFEPGTTVSH